MKSMQKSPVVSTLKIVKNRYKKRQFRIVTIVTYEKSTVNWLVGQDLTGTHPDPTGTPVERSRSEPTGDRCRSNTTGSISGMSTQQQLNNKIHCTYYRCLNRPVRPS